ncbi:M48 family metallopeptidase [Campylobacter portucalensis]|uniref:M48 family metallopeptidase n=1 Tax=Campylobacter portucalensis TaxID=2608384 RepID=UPI002DD9D3DA|nr:SprT family zinc-dependent metalloprotease [Campylobacter portucalensis]
MNFQAKSTIIKVDEFEIFVIKKRIKYARIKVDKQGFISLNLPLNYPKDLAKKFLNENLEWIRSKANNAKSKILPKNKTMLLGKIYEFKFDDSFKSVKIIGDEIHTPNLEKYLKFKKEFAKNEFNKFIEIYAPIIGKNINKVTIRDMKTRWGSCNSTKGYINLAINLVEKSPDLIEYVILHELTHLLYPHHQKSFYNYIENLMPDFKAREKKLKN